MRSTAEGLVDVDPIVRDDAIRIKDVIHVEGCSETQGMMVEKLADRSIFQENSDW